MKLQIIKSCAAVLFMVVSNQAVAQQIDPVLAGAVTVSGIAEYSAINKTKDAQNKIATYQAVITVELDRIRDYESKMYSYLQNASSAVKNAIEIKQAGEITVEIAKLFNELRKSAAANPQGVLMLGIVSKEISKASSDMVGIYSYISTLSLSTKVLLNSAERSQITWTVLYKLRRIKTSLYLLKFQIENYTLADLPQVLFPIEHFYAVDGKRIADDIIRDFKKL